MAINKHASEKYYLIPENDSETNFVWYRSASSTRSKVQKLITAILWLLLVASLILNIKLVVNRNDSRKLVTEWAGLTYEVPTPIYSSTEYGTATENEAERDLYWEALDISEGLVAISDDLALSKGLPLSQRFPWDQSKGLYLLGAHHQIHCLKRIHRYVSAAHQNNTSRSSYHHVIHCLDSLLQDAWCHADDTPWMQLPPEPYRQRYAQYQTRQCKSWDKLMTWAREHNSCYQMENILDSSGQPTNDGFEHFKYCPEGSPFTPVMEKWFAQRAQGYDVLIDG